MMTTEERRSLQREQAVSAGESAFVLGKPCDAQAYIKDWPRYMDAAIEPNEVRAAFTQAYERVAQAFSKIAPVTKFERVRRDCPHNNNVDAGHKGKLIFDWRAFVNGDHVATFKSNGSGTRGYYLADREEVRIKVPSRGYRDVAIEVDKKDAFARVLAQYYYLVPTPAQLDERRAEKAREKAADIARQKENATDQVLAKYAREMYGVLLQVALDQRRAIIAKITAEISEWHASIDRGDG